MTRMKKYTLPERIKNLEEEIAITNFKILAASIAPSAAPAPTIV